MKTLSQSSAALSQGDGFLIGRFEAMACPCEILLDTSNPTLMAELLNIAQQEAERIESKYSRYRSGNVVDRINTSQGKQVEVDEETAALLDYAANNYELSHGLFDITTGILRKIWRFDGAEKLVPPKQLDQIRTRIGWDKVTWKRPFIQLPEGFEIDLGGICKEYAADKILALLVKHNAPSSMVNLGGDIAVAGKRLWSVGIEDIHHSSQVIHTLHLRAGGVATSGTTKRFVKLGGETYGHILNPKTGWPVKNAPASVTVASKTCTEAGFWSTLAVLHGSEAETFLKEQSLEFWCFR